MAKPLKDEDIQTAENIFREYLRDRGLKYTRERETLLRAVLGNDEHFEAEQLLISLRQSGKRVAKATIYRTLPLLVSCGIIKQVQFGDSLARYEHTFGQDPHDHMICRRCRRIIEFDSAEVVRLRAEVAARYQFHPLSHRLQITGLCSDCVQACPAAQIGDDGGAAPLSTEPRMTESSG
ncbi:MAG: transcriptional repressor [Phycisphaerae bacterium]